MVAWMITFMVNAKEKLNSNFIRFASSRIAGQNEKEGGFRGCGSCSTIWYLNGHMVEGVNHWPPSKISHFSSISSIIIILLMVWNTHMAAMAIQAKKKNTMRSSLHSEPIISPFSTHTHTHARLLTLFFHYTFLSSFFFTLVSLLFLHTTTDDHATATEKATMCMCVCVCANEVQTVANT